MDGTRQEAGSQGQRAPRRFARPVSDEHSALGGGNEQDEWQTVGPSGNQQRRERSFHQNPNGSLDRRHTQDSGQGTGYQGRRGNDQTQNISGRNSQELKQNRRRRNLQITCSYCGESYKEGEPGEHMKYLHVGSPYINWPSVLGDLVNWQCPKLEKDAEKKFLETSFDDYKALRVFFDEVRNAIDINRRKYFDDNIELLEENLKQEITKERRLMFKKKRHVAFVDATKELFIPQRYQRELRYGYHSGYQRNIIESAPVEPTSVKSAPVEPTSVKSAPVEPVPVEPTSVKSTSVKSTSAVPTPGHWEFWKKANYQRNIASRKSPSMKHQKKGKKIHEDDFDFILKNGLGFIADDSDSDPDESDPMVDSPKNPMVDFYALALLGEQAGRVGLYQIKTIINPILPYVIDDQDQSEHALEMRTMKDILLGIPKLAAVRADTRSSEHRGHMKKGNITKFNYTNRWAIVYGTSRITLNYSIVFVLDSKTLEFLKTKKVVYKSDERVAESLIAWSYYDPSLLIGNTISIEDTSNEQDEGFTFTLSEDVVTAENDIGKIEDEIKKKVEIVRAKEIEDMNNPKEKVVLSPASWVTGSKISNRNKAMADDDFFFGDEDVEYDQKTEDEVKLELGPEFESEPKSEQKNKPMISKWFQKGNDSDSESESESESDSESEDDFVGEKKPSSSKWLRSEPISTAEMELKAKRLARIQEQKTGKKSTSIPNSKRLTGKDESWFENL